MPLYAKITRGYKEILFCNICLYKFLRIPLYQHYGLTCLHEMCSYFTNTNYILTDIFMTKFDKCKLICFALCYDILTICLNLQWIVLVVNARLNIWWEWNNDQVLIFAHSCTYVVLYQCFILLNTFNHLGILKKQNKTKQNTARHKIYKQGTTFNSSSLPDYTDNFHGFVRYFDFLSAMASFHQLNVNILLMRMGRPSFDLEQTFVVSSELALTSVCPCDLWSLEYDFVV